MDIEGAVDFHLNSRGVSVAVVIASLYAVLTVALGSFGYSWIQVRISEALTPLPFIFGPPAILGLTLGVVIANLFSPVGMADIIFGPLLTLIAAILSWKFSYGKRLIACTYPVVINALGVSAYIASFYGVPYMMSVVSIGVGEFIAAVLLGYPLLKALERTQLVHER